ncbi:MAG: transglycosylase SLT domain-containing protein [Burkholderiaceae bacterium]
MATRSNRRRARACAILLCAGLAWSFVAAAHADVWTYVDDKGVPHFASERVDDRYELFFRSAESFDTSQDATEPEPSHGPMPVPSTPSKLMNFFEVSPTFKQVRQNLREASADHNVDFELLQALIATESGFNSSAVSPKGAVGLMQIMPATARRYGVESDRKLAIETKLADPRINIKTGTRYLSDLIKMFPGQIELALAAYNAGEGAVQRAGNQIPNYKETQNYVKTVMALYQMLKPAPALSELRHPLSRVRTTLRGGALNRGNLPPGAPLAAGGAKPGFDSP